MQRLIEFPLVIVIIILSTCNISHSTPRDHIPSIQLQQFDIDLVNERHRSPLFDYQTINTALPYSYNDLPKKSSITVDHMEDKEVCKASLTVELQGFTHSKKTICLHKDDFDEILFVEESRIAVFDREYKIKDFHAKTLPVAGFVQNEPNSVVNGYLINKQFYGTIRLYDDVNAYITHFYIEPIENAPLYSDRFLNEKIEHVIGNENAIIFEYIPHEEDLTLPDRPFKNDSSTGDLDPLIIGGSGPLTTTDPSDLDPLIIVDTGPLTSTSSDDLTGLIIGGAPYLSSTSKDDLTGLIIGGAAPLTTTLSDDLTGLIIGGAPYLSSTSKDDLTGLIIGGAPYLSSTSKDDLTGLIIGGAAPLSTTSSDDLTGLIIGGAPYLSSTSSDDLNSLINGGAAPLSTTTEDDFGKIIDVSAIPITSTEDDFNLLIDDSARALTSTTEDEFGKIIVASAVPLTSTGDDLDPFIDDSAAALTSTTEDDFGKIIDVSAISITSTENDFDAIIVGDAAPLTSTTEDEFGKIIVASAVPLTSTGDDLDPFIDDKAAALTSTTEDEFGKIIVASAVPLTSTGDDLDPFIDDSAAALTSTTEDEFGKIILGLAVPLTSTENEFDAIIVGDAAPLTSTTEDDFGVIISGPLTTTEDDYSAIFVSNATSVTSENPFDSIVVENSIPITTTENGFDTIIDSNLGPLTSTTEDEFGKIILAAAVPLTSTENEFDTIIIGDAAPLTSTTEDEFGKIILAAAVPLTSTENEFDSIIVGDAAPLTSTTEDEFGKIIVAAAVPLTSTENEFDAIIVGNAAPLTSTTEDEFGIIISGPLTTTEDDYDAIVVSNATSVTTNNPFDMIIVDNSFPITTTESDFDNLIDVNVGPLTSTASQLIIDNNIDNNAMAKSTTTEDDYPLKNVWTTTELSIGGSFPRSSTLSGPPGGSFSTTLNNGLIPLLPWMSTPAPVYPPHFHSTKKSASRHKGNIHHYHSTRRPGIRRRIRKKLNGTFGIPPGRLSWTTDASTGLNDSGLVTTDASSHFHSTKKTKTKSKHHFHSTRVPKGKRRKRAAPNIFSFHDNLIYGHDDNVEFSQFKSGSAESDLFDMRREDSFICSLCIWVQPNFAAKFAYNSDMEYGLAEIVDVVRIINWLFRAFDFNEDGIPENIGFVIKRILVADDITFDSISLGIHTKASNASNGTANLNGEEFLQDYIFDKEIHDIGTKEALAVVANKLHGNFVNCCAIFGFVYHNLAPAISTTTIRGLCTTRNIAIISGYLHRHKIGKYDLVRAMLHSLGHLFGSEHDDILEDACMDRELYSFLNPFPMHPIEQVNVGLRPDSLKMSLCSKISIARYLTTNGPSCLQSEKQNFCGNGVVDDGEECDCGSMWQCSKPSPCCGESGSTMACKILRNGHHGCERFTDW